jgi:hypothetical protein
MSEMVKTGSAYWAILLAGTALLSIVWAGTSEVTVLALLAGYFFGISSPESKMNAEFAKHLNNSKVYTPYGKLIPQSEFSKMKRYNENINAIEAMKKMNPSFFQNQEEE